MNRFLMPFLQASTREGFFVHGANVVIFSVPF